METETVLFAVDADYAPHLATALYSLLVHNGDINLEVQVFSCSLSATDQAQIRAIGEKFNTRIIFSLLDDRFAEGLVLGNHFSKSTYYRLLAADLIPGKRCLYLDSDIVVNDSIAPIFQVDLGTAFLAAVEDVDWARSPELEMDQEAGYFNAGVMLMNLDKWRETELKDAVLALIRRRPETIRYVDQCGLNSIVNGNWIPLEKKYNLQNYMLAGKKFRLTEWPPTSWMEDKPSVIHFSGGSKPWQLTNTHPYRRLYWQMRNQTAYRKLLSDNLGIAGRIIKNLRIK